MHTRRGVSLIELVVVMAIISLMLSMVFIRRRAPTELDSTVKQMVAMLREAQSRSMSQANSSGWGVYLNNATSGPTASLYYGTYGTGTVTSVFRIYSGTNISASSLAQGATTSISFSQITGTPSASTTIKFELAGDSGVSSTIRIASSGAISFTQW